MLKKIKKK